MSTRSFVYILLGFIWTYVVMAPSITIEKRTPQVVKPLPQEAYHSLKKALVTQGTTIATVVITSSAGHRFCGILVNYGTNAVIVTVAHPFAKRNSSATYEYILDGKKYPVHRVCSHPKQGTLGGKDIAFCFPGELSTIEHYWTQQKKATYPQVWVRRCDPLQATLLHSFETVSIKGTLASIGNEEDPVYFIEHKSEDGDSGMSLMSTNQRLFVLMGNLKGANFDVVEFFGITASNISFITEL